MEEGTADRKRNAKHPAKVLTLAVGRRRRTIPAGLPALRSRSTAPGIRAEGRIPAFV
jgi:hypothetical protein